MTLTTHGDLDEIRRESRYLECPLYGSLTIKQGLVGISTQRIYGSAFKIEHTTTDIDY